MGNNATMCYKKKYHIFVRIPINSLHLDVKFSVQYESFKINV